MDMVSSGVFGEKEHKKHVEICFKQYFKPLCFYAMSFVKNDETAKDIVHDVFLSVWNRREEIDFSQPMYPYFLSIVRNNTLNYLAHLKVKSRHEEFQRKFENQYIEPDFDGHEELIRSIMERIDRLPNRCGEVMRLCFVECKKYKEIAEMLDISVNTVKAHITTGLRILRDEFPTSLLFICFLKSRN